MAGFLVIMLLAAVELRAELQVQIAPDVCTLGEPLTLTLRQSAADERQIIWPEFAGMPVEPFEILADRAVSERERQLIVAPFALGTVHFPSLQLSWFTASDSTVRTLQTDSLQVQVVSITDSLQVPQARQDSLLSGGFTVRDPLERSLALADLLVWFYIAAALMALALIVWWYFRHRGGSLRALTSEILDTRTPWERFQDDMQEVRQEKFWQRGELAEFYFRLSLALRRYLEGRSSLLLAEMTTDEIARIRSHLPLTQQQQDDLVQLLQQADLVKFAGYTPADREHETYMEQVNRLADECEQESRRQELTQEVDA